MEAMRRIPDATVDRLPVYLRVLDDLTASRSTTVSSEQLADLAGMNAAKVRKDLSYLGSYGVRGVGYDVDYLRFEITSQLGLGQQSGVAIVGLGNLGRALANHAGLTVRGFPVTALLDTDARKVGTSVSGVTISHLDALSPDDGIAIGIITTPPGVAQDVADRLVAAGVRAILNFAPIVLTVPEHVALRSVDVTLELQVLSFYASHQGSGTAAAHGS
jgi:redox-sensing transcriptional repressor